MNRKKIYWGLLFICAAIMVFVSQLGLLSGTGIGVWHVVLALILIPLFIKSIVSVQFFGIFLSLALLFISFAKPLQKALGYISASGEILNPVIDKLIPGPTIIMALLLSIGCSIIFAKKKHKKAHIKKHDRFIDGESVVSESFEDELDYDAFFGSSIKYITSKNLRSARFSCSFGAMKLYFDNATLSPEGAVFNISLSFGGIEMYIPKGWRVINDTNAFFGGVDEKNQPKVDENVPTIVIKGDISFGGLEIIYV